MSLRNVKNFETLINYKWSDWEQAQSRGYPRGADAARASTTDNVKSSSLHSPSPFHVPTRAKRFPSPALMPGIPPQQDTIRKMNELGSNRHVQRRGQTGLDAHDLSLVHSCRKWVNLPFQMSYKQGYYNLKECHNWKCSISTFQLLLNSWALWILQNSPIKFY